ncbi:putative reverse transcriptase domain, reverse transcriptase zinc-binding domain protein, partial [Tanacetum coccineum]
MKSLKKPFRKLIYDQGNLHDRVVKLRAELDEVQKAFDLDSDNVLLREKEAVYVQVDIQKAYDTVDWGFLKKILRCFGFHPTMIKWIMACVTSASFSISINGDIHGYFKGKRGLRQGDPLSPYLFTLVMEVLTLLLKRKVRLSDSFRYHKHCEDLQLINVCVADDLFIFARCEVDSARIIMEGLDEFKLSSGLVPSI